MDTRGPARTRYMVSLKLLWEVQAVRLNNMPQDLLSLGVIVDPFFISSSEEPFDNEYYWNVSTNGDLNTRPS